MRRFLIISMIFSFIACSKVDDDHNYVNNSSNNNNDAGVDSSFRVTLVTPSHGPSLGGTQVEIRGFGFDEVTHIYFGDTWADPNETFYVDQNRMLATVPAGHAGTVEVKAVRGDSSLAVLENAYTYDAVKLDPSAGPIAGGTLIRIYSPDNEFRSDDEFYLGDKLLEDVEYISSGLVTGKTPAANPGVVDFTVKHADGTELKTVDAFEYYESADPGYGGMNGIVVNGSVTVTVLNYYTKEPVEGAFVMLGADPNTPFKGHASQTGQITFSSPDLKGLQMVTAAMTDFETTSFIGFDASEITVFLTPLADPPSQGGGIPHIPDSVYSHVSGGISLRLDEFNYSCKFDTMVPDPIPEGYIKVIRLYQSLSWYDNAAAAVYKIYEVTQCIEGFGYPFALTIWPGVFALYALAGYEDAEGKNFTPTAYGIIRNIVAGPGESFSYNLKIDRFLDTSMSVNLSNLPPLDPVNGPVELRVKLIMNLGSDGFILREDTIFKSSENVETVLFDNLMAIAGPLDDASYSVYAEVHNNGTYPFSQYFIQSTFDNPVVMDSFLALPSPVSPVVEPPVNNRFIYNSGVVKPTFVSIKYRTFPAGDPWWTVYINGEMASYTLPDLSGIQGVPQTPAGEIYWNLQSVLVPSLDFNNFSYRYLNKRYWSANAADGDRFTY
ncbi:IPT/TIG domain-containing protein [Myxococcota bacterium]|nr:IPT/TIG domain-containing protein [Myxococcota bacterium]MBU1380367.1 IPT/TIG domain-containing protein [Myxococcota bacterium]MBU1497345.1 IPT/TIG domain-containing protein [Myxococcota bacterium]